MNGINVIEKSPTITIGSFQLHLPTVKKTYEVLIVGGIHIPRMLLTRHYNQRPIDETMCDAIIANGGVKNRQKVQNVCDDRCIKHSSDFSCVCDSGHIVQFN